MKAKTASDPNPNNGFYQLQDERPQKRTHCLKNDLSELSHPVCLQLGGIGLEAGSDSQVVEAKKAAARKGDVDLVIHRHGEDCRCSSRRIRTAGGGGKEDSSSLGYQASPALLLLLC